MTATRLSLEITVFESLRDGWRKLVQQEPGLRFEQRYHGCRRPSLPRGTLRRIIMLTIGVMLTVVGILMLVLPGPGLLVMVIGLGILAEESLILARWLDRLELWLSGLWRRIRRR